ncbi:MAG: SEC-C metal-binding domain-containing protein, partial [Candidatus Binatia bacterium]
ILLGGNPDFLARAEIEKQWLNNKISAVNAAAMQTAKSYEESLEELRAEYNETISQARQKYEPEWLPFENARNGALKRMTETYRPYLRSSWQKAKVEYEEIGTQVGIFNHGTINQVLLDRYMEAKAAYEHALGEYDKVIGPALSEDQMEEFEVARNDFTEVLAVAGGNETSPQLITVRNRYERILNEYNRAILRLAEVPLSTNGEVLGEYKAASNAYAEAVRAYEEAERQYEEKHRPYEEAVAAAEKAYEEQRKERVKVVEEVREQLEKAPDVYEQMYDEIVEKYKVVCIEEREKVLAAGGLHILGTERHEARRIDNQLRGRAGRQGDPGTSRFYLSLEDDLLRIFGAERIQKVMDRLGMEEGEPIEHGLVTRAIENAQKRVEQHNFDIRKHLLEYDDVMNKQREVIYQQRRGFLAGDNLKGEIFEMVDGLVEQIAATYVNEELPAEEYDWKSLDDALFRQFNFRLSLSADEQQDVTRETLPDLIRERAVQSYEEREQTFTAPVMRYLEKMILLQTMDGLWKDHLLSMDHLKEGIGLRGYGQRNPLQEYQKEAFAMFEELSRRMQEDVVEKLYTVQIARQEDAQRIEQPRRMPQRQVLSSHGGMAAQATPARLRREAPKVGRNDLCPCGSGKKYKKCHGT